MTLLSSIIGQPVEGYRAPYFSITANSLWALPILARLGIRYDSSVHPVVNHRYGIPAAPRWAHTTEAGLLEIPITTFPLGVSNLPCGGGVYFRVYPYRMTHGLLSRLRRRGESLVFYLHPWELDPHHPRIQVPWTLKTRHYWALDRTADKLEDSVGTLNSLPLQGPLSRD